MTLIPLTTEQLETLHALTLVEPATVSLVQITLGHLHGPYARLQNLVDLGLATRYVEKLPRREGVTGKPPHVYELTPAGRAIGLALQPAVARMRDWKEGAPAPTRAPDVLEAGTAELRDD